VDCDLQNFDSVAAAAKVVAMEAAAYGGLDGFVANAGVMGVPDTRTADGFDVQIQTNHLSHWLLTMLLMPSLEVCACVLHAVVLSRCFAPSQLRQAYLWLPQGCWCRAM
jgi:NAD(P)-dependent dehydrogenase (short-subunit alcohol dehydrogenase family)